MEKKGISISIPDVKLKSSKKTKTISEYHNQPVQPFSFFVLFLGFCASQAA
jgi:hypothetical protein